MASPAHKKSAPPARRLSTTVRTAKGRTVSSKRWLERQLNDPYVTQAKRLGYRSRSAFKLLDIDLKEHFLKPYARVVDLGAAPGGWSQVCAEKIGAPEKGRIIAIDVHGIEPLSGVTFLKKDFLEPDALDLLMNALDGEKADVVLSDMAAHATGHRKTDHLKNIALCEAAFEFACLALKPGGVFLCKVLRGGTEHTLLATIKQRFRITKHIKPPSSRKESAELFLYAQGYLPPSLPLQEKTE